MRSFGLVEEKLAEAEFFIDQISELKFGIFPAQCYLNAFLSSSRSVTFAIQASIGDIPDFEAWYKNIQNRFKKDEIAQWLLKCRNESIHIGIAHIKSGQEVGDEYKFYFQSIFDMDDEGPKEDVLTACRHHMKNLVDVVFECFEKFGFYIDPDMYYSIQNAERTGKSIEIFETELNFPMGSTYHDGFNLKKRLQILRESQPVLEVDFLFEKYLDKNRLPILQREGIA